LEILSQLSGCCAARLVTEKRFAVAFGRQVLPLMLERRSDMVDMTPIGCPERLEVLASGEKTQIGIWTAEDVVGIFIALTVVLPKADGAYFKRGRMGQREITATGAAPCWCLGNDVLSTTKALEDSIG
jgi:hypothetical protein